MPLEFTDNPDHRDITTLTEKINEETRAQGLAVPFGIFERDANGSLIAGLNGYIVYGAAYTDQLWVRPEYRARGIARKMMEKVFEYGREQGCTIATVQTMNFQGARDFYLKLGFEVDFERTSYANGVTCIFLMKRL